jgi:hypothetical protein
VAWGGKVLRTEFNPPTVSHSGGGGGVSAAGGGGDGDGGGGGKSSAVPATWSKFMRHPVHDRTANLVHRYRHQDESAPFDQSVTF